MKQLLLLLCALCASVSSAAGQSSRLRELLRSDPRFSYPAPAEPSGPASLAFTERFSLEVSYRTEESFEDWVAKKPGYHDWLTVSVRNIGKRVGAEDILGGLRFRPGPDSELRMRPSGRKLLRYGWGPREFSDSWWLNFDRAIGRPFARAAMDALSF